MLHRFRDGDAAKSCGAASRCLVAETTFPDHGRMSPDTPSAGKVSRSVFDKVILPHLGRRPAEVLVPPQNGVDVGVVNLGHDRVMITTTDPVFVYPEYGWERAAWFAIHILASDAATSGIAAQYMAIDLNLPPMMPDDDFAVLWQALHAECDKLGIAIVSGHTGRYEGCAFPMIGGATMIGIGSKDRYLTPAMAQPGDRIIITKGAAIETTGLFGVTYPKLLVQKLGQQVAEEAEAMFWQMSVVDDALTAVSVGVRQDGVTSMHDATERGIWGALVEVAQASGNGIMIDKAAIILPDASQRVCELFRIDPYCTSSEGTLIITCRPHKAAEVVRRLAGQGIASSDVGEIVAQDSGIKYRDGGREFDLVAPEVDPFWEAFQRADKGLKPLARGLSAM
ncbi:MAG: AIR synthase family protein [Candidatus Zixiibacteriota bacterium]